MAHKAPVVLSETQHRDVLVDYCVHDSLAQGEPILTFSFINLIYDC